MEKPKYVRNQKGHSLVTHSAQTIIGTSKIKRNKMDKIIIDPLNITETDRFFEELEAEEIEF